MATCRRSISAMGSSEGFVVDVEWSRGTAELSHMIENKQTGDEVNNDPLKRNRYEFYFVDKNGQGSRYGYVFAHDLNEAVTTYRLTYGADPRDPTHTTAQYRVVRHGQDRFLNTPVSIFLSPSDARKKQKVRAWRRLRRLSRIVS